jgi:hypothetical protein
MDERTFMMESEVFRHLQWVMILFRVLTKKFVKGESSQFQNCRVNFHKFHILFSMKLSQLGQFITSFV